MRQKFIIGCMFLLSCFFSISAFAQTPAVLIVKKVTIQVNGKPARVFKIEQPDGTWGYQGVKGQDFNVLVKNETNVPTVIHWHGLIDPNNQDGVPYVTQLPIPPGGQYHYDFKLKQSGTYWMHSHYGFQIQQLLSAPLIITDPQSKYADDQNVVMLLTDFSFKNPKAIFADLKKPVMQTKKDLNDVKYDAFLTNYHDLNQPQIVNVTPGKKIRLRIIDGSAGTNFFIHLGVLKGTLIAVDGEHVKPITGSTFTMAIGQRVDIEVAIPKDTGAYPILAQGEGNTMQTGLIIVTPGAKIPTVSEKAATVAGAITDQQELSLRAAHPLPVKKIERVLTVNMQGNMKKYSWTLNGQAWPNVTPLEVKKGERVEMVFNNETSMSHPMHLHGHVFEVTDINGKRFQGAMRDTVLVPAHGTVKVIFDADNPGNWMLHCHVLYHEAAGMMTIVNYKGYPEPNWSLIRKESSH